MVDMDEFLYLVEDNSLNDYLNNNNFEKCDFIKFNWAISTDNNLLHYDNRSLFERFKPPYIANPAESGPLCCKEFSIIVNDLPTLCVF
jgi:hypothetical protein